MHRMLLLLSLLLVGQVCLSAQVEPDMKFEKLEKSTSKPKKVGLGIEGGWNQNFTAWEGDATKGTGRLGLTIMAGKMVDGVMPKYTYDTSLGYIFAQPDRGASFAWGFYGHGTFNANFRLKNSNNYFYTGYGFGFDFIDNKHTLYNTDFQLVRLPLGFKFLTKEDIEFFIEANFSMGVSVDSYAVNGNYGMSFVKFSANTDFKAGLRFWL